VTPPPTSGTVTAASIKAALARGGQTINVPAGVFDISSSPVASNTKLIGVGNATVIKGNLFADSIQNLTVSNLALRGANTLAQAFKFKTVSKMSLSKLDIQEYPNGAIHFHTNTDVTISDVKISKSTRAIRTAGRACKNIDGYTTGLFIGISSNLLVKNTVFDASVGGRAIGVFADGNPTRLSNTTFDNIKITTDGDFNAPWNGGGENICSSPQLSMELWHVNGNISVRNSTFVGGAVSLAGAPDASFKFENNSVQTTKDFQYGVEVYGNVVASNNTFTGPGYGAYLSIGEPGTLNSIGDKFNMRLGAKKVISEMHDGSTPGILKYTIR
jgi:hypothetical protein